MRKSSFAAPCPTAVLGHRESTGTSGWSPPAAFPCACLACSKPGDLQNSGEGYFCMSCWSKVASAISGSNTYTVIQRAVFSRGHFKIRPPSSPRRPAVTNLAARMNR